MWPPVNIAVSSYISGYKPAAKPKFEAFFNRQSKRSVVCQHSLGAAQKLGKDGVLLLIGGIVGLVVSLQYQLALVADIAEDMQKLFPVDVAIPGK